MGGGVGGYVTITLQTLLSESPTSGRVHRVSELLFKGAPTPDDRRVPRDLTPATPPLVPGTPPVGKLGLGGLAPGDVVDFHLYARMDDDTLMDMGVVKSDGVRQELQAAFGGEWTGFAVAVGPTGGRFRLVSDITFNFVDAPGAAKPLADKPFKVIPVVMAFGTDQFAKHYLLAVIVAQKTGDSVDTSVTQPYQ